LLAGEGCGSWVTYAGSAIFIAAVEWILGIRRELNGFIIDPCIPKQWRKIRVIYPFRGTKYTITIENPEHIENGVKEICVNKEKIPGNLISSHSHDDTVDVKVVLGITESKNSRKTNKINAVI
jgi:cellobiose phosphorylase